MNDDTFVASALEVVVKIATAMFAGLSARDELVADTVSVAWEMSLTTPDEIPPRRLAWYAVKRVKSGRQFHESTRSITGPNHDHRPKPGRLDVSLMTVPGRGDPARIVEYRLDFRAWLARLDDRRRGIALMLAMGYATGEVADAYGVSDSLISGARKRLKRSWYAFRER